MARTKKILLSVLVGLVVLTASFYFIFNDEVKLDIQKTKNIYSIMEDGSWTKAATEYVNLFDGTAKMRAKSRSLEYSTSGDITTVTKIANFKDNINLVETLLIDSSDKDIENFPAYRSVECYNCKGKIVHFEYRDILYTGETKSISSPFSFGHKMKLEWQEGAYLSKVYQQKVASDKIVLRYKPKTSYEKYEVRLFDPAPVVSNIIINGGSNFVSDNLSLSFIVTDDDGDAVKNIFDWRLNGTSIAVLNMPFENNTPDVTSTTKDYSQFENNGTVTGATFNSTGGYGGNGAYEFDGVTGGITIPQTQKLNLSGSDGMSISLRFKGNNFDLATDTGDVLISQYDGNFGFVIYSFDDTGDEALWYSPESGAGEGDYALSNFNEGQWYHLVMTYDLTTAILYLDGVQVDNITISAPIIAGNINTTIGDGEDGVWNGTIDDVLIFNHSLTPEQIQTIYNNRTDLIVNQETSLNDNWSACITSNDGKEDGNEVCSSNLRIVSPTDNYTFTDSGNTVSSSVSDVDGSVTSYTLYYEDVSGNWITEEPTYVDSITFGFNFTADTDTSNLIFNITASKSLSLVENLTVRYLESSNQISVGGISPYADTTYKIINYTEFETKNPLATFTLTSFIKNGLVGYELNAIGATDFDPSIIDDFSSTVLGTFDDTRIDTTALSLENERDAILIYNFNTNDTDSVVRDFSDYNIQGENSKAVWNGSAGHNGLGAYEFNGSETITVPYNNAFDLTGKNFSVTGWIFAKTTTVQRSVVDSSNLVPRWEMGIGSTNKFFVHMHNGNNPKTFSSVGTINNAWHFFGVTFDRSGSTTIYLDGVFSSSTDISLFGDFFNDVPLEIGSNANTSNFFNGTIDDIIIYNRSLSASEIADIYTENYTYVPKFRRNGNWTSTQLDFEYLTNVSNATFYFNGSFDTDGLINRDLTSPKLKAWWTFDNTTSSDIGSYTETLNEVFNDSTGINGSYWYDGNQSKITVTNHKDLGFTDAITISAWANPHSVSHQTSNDYVILSKGDAYRIALNNNGQVSCVTTGVSDFDTVTTLGISLDKWTQVICTYNASSGIRSIYFNGELTAQETGLSNDIDTSPSSVLFGTNADNNQFFMGSIDEIKLYNRSLSSSEILSEYHDALGNKLEIEVCVNNSTSSSKFSDCYNNTVPTSGEFTINESAGLASHVQLKFLFGDLADTEFPVEIFNYNLTYDNNTCNCPAVPFSWAVESKNRCVLKVSCDITGYPFILNGDSGWFKLEANLTADNVSIESGSNFAILSDGNELRVVGG